MLFASSFFNSSNVWFGYIANAFFTVGALAALAKVVQKYFTRHSSKELDRIEKELIETKKDMDDKLEQLLSQHRNNGGSSAKDQWDRMETKVDHLMGLEEKVDGMSRAFNRHLGYHEGLRDAEEE